MSSPKLAGFDNLDQLVVNDTESDIEERDPAAAPAGQCTLANLKKIIFDNSKALSQLLSTQTLAAAHHPSLTHIPTQAWPNLNPPATQDPLGASTGTPTPAPSAPTVP
jgi:hypothetical protein